MVVSRSLGLWSVGWLLAGALLTNSGGSLQAQEPKATDPAPKEQPKEQPKAEGNFSAAAKRHFDAALALQRKELWEFAIEEWKGFLEKYPKEPVVIEAAHYNLGTCYMKAKKYPDAVATFEGLIKAFPQYNKLDDTYLNLGISQFSAGRDGKPDQYPAAAKTFATLVEKYPRSTHVPQAIYLKGEALYNAGEKKDAAKAYALVVATADKNPVAPDALYALGVTQHELDDKAGAAKSYEDFLKRYPDNSLAADIKLKRGELHFSAKEYGPAAAQYAAAAASPNFGQADYALLRQGSALVAEKKYAEAAAIFDSIPTKYPQSKHVLPSQVAGGRALYQLAKYADARTTLAKTLAAQSPESIEAGHWIARSYLAETPKKAVEALAAADAALKLPQASASPFYTSLFMDRADALFEIPERRGEASAAYADVAAKHAQDPLAAEAQYMAAFSSMENKKFEDALKYAKAFMPTFGASEFAPHVWSIAAESSLQLKNFEESRKYFDELRQKFPQHPLARQGGLRQALSMYLDKKPVEALAAANAFLKDANDPEQIAEAQHLIGRVKIDAKDFAAALDALQAALKAKADWRQADETLLLTAHALAQSMKPADAQARLKEMITKYPQSSHAAEARYRLAESLYGSGDIPGSALEYTTVIEKFPASPFAAHAQYGLGWTQYSGGKAEDAIGSFSTVIDKHPALANKARYARALAEHQLKKYAEATADLNAFLKAAPAGREALDARYVLGLCQTGEGKWADAEKTFAEILAADPAYPGGDKVGYELGWARKELKREADAAAAFAQLAEKFPASPLAAEALYHVAENQYAIGSAQLRTANEAEDKQAAATAKQAAAAAFTAALKPYEESRAKAGASDLGEKAAHKQGWTLYKLDDFNKAAAQFAKQLTDFPAGKLAADGLFMQAECLFKQAQYEAAAGAYDKAIAALAKAENANKDFFAAALLHGAQSAAKLKSPNFTKSLELTGSLLKQFPDTSFKAEALYEQAWALQNTGKLDEALKVYTEVADLSPTDEAGARAWFQRGEIFFKKKEHAEAIRNFVKASVYPFPVWASYAEFEMGRCFEVLGQNDKAKGVYEGLLKRYPECEQAAAARDRLKALGG